jgi:hypothetical protein
MIVVCFVIQVAHPAGKPPMVGRILVRIVDVPLRFPISENDRYRPCRPKKPKPHTFSFVLRVGVLIPMSGHRASDEPRGNSSNNYGGLTQLFFAWACLAPRFSAICT